MIRTKVEFFFVGFPKSGSTTLYDLMRSHPEVFSPAVKEFNFFNTDLIQEARKRLKDDYFQLAETEEAYMGFFRGGETKIKGDFTPYNIFSEAAARNIFAYNPEGKILVSIREPVSFLRSFHFQSLYNMIEDEPDFLRAISLEEDRRAGRNIPKHCYNRYHLYYSFLVEYKQHIKRFTDVFGCQNVKVILFDDIVENELGVYRDALQFLGVDEMDHVPPRANQNPSHGLRFAGLREFLFTPPIKKWLYTRTPRSLLPLGAKVSQSIFKRPQEKPLVAAQDIERLKARFRPNVIELHLFLKEAGLLDRDLRALWGY